MSDARPLKPDRVRFWVQRYASEYEAQTRTGEPLVATNGQRGAVRKYLCEAIKDAALRHEVYAWLFSLDFVPLVPMTTKQFTDAQWLALKRWIGAKLDESPITGEGEWAPDPAWSQEIEWVSWQAKREFHPVQGEPVDHPLLTEARLHGGVVIDMRPVSEPVTAPVKPVQPTLPTRTKRATFTFD